MTLREAQILTEEINTVRRQNKDKWYYYKDDTFGIRLKGYNTWIQRIERGKFVGGSPMDMSVKGFKAWLVDWLVGTR